MGIAAQKIAEREAAASEFIPYSHHATPTVIATVKAEYLSVWKLAGRPHQSASQDDVFRWVDELNTIFRSVLTENFAVHSTIVRRRVDEYPEATYWNVFARDLDAKYKATFAGANTMVNDIYLTVIHRPHGDKVLRFLGSGERISPEERAARQAAALKALDEANRVIGSSMERYGAKLLGCYDRDGWAYSEALEFLASLVNGEHHSMPVMAKRFREYMVVNRPFFATHGEVGEIRTLTGSRYFGVLEIADYDSRTEPGQLNNLLESDCEFVLSQSFAALSLLAAKGLMQKQQRHLVDANDLAVSQVEGISSALDQLISGEFVMGEHYCSLLVWGDSPIAVRQNMAEARTAMGERGIIPKVADMALEAAFWAQLPANFQYRPRPSTITSQNFLCFSSFHNFMRGKANRNPWGAAVTILKTTSRTPIYFNFHSTPIEKDSTDERALGNTMILGQSGSGKTVLLSFLMAQLQSAEPTIVAFDKDRGMEIAVRALGGVYLPLEVGKPSGFNPFQMEPTPANLAFLRRLVAALASGGGVPISHRDEVEIDRALDALMHHIDKRDRNLSTLLQSLPNPMTGDEGRPTVHARLLKWAGDGPLGWLFDNADDALNLESHRIYGFDVTEFLDNAEIRAPIMMYLLHRTGELIDGRRFVYVLDEFWKLMEDEYFVDLARNELKTARKKNAIFVFATQEPEDALRSTIAKTLVSQCATFVLLPNPTADREDYVDRLKLTEAEFDLVLSLGETSRRFVVKQGEGTAIAELNLRGFNDELLVLSGTPDNAELVGELIDQHGDDPAVWLPLFYRAKRQGV
jgi:type IV secretion system protein VirB4